MMVAAIFYSVDSYVLAIILFFGIILFYFFGLRISQSRRKNIPAIEPGGMGAFEGAMLGLIFLLLAFTFNKSASYYDTRRELLVHEINCIGTALHRTDLYPDSLRNAFRKDFREYILARIQYFEAGDNKEKIQAALQEAKIISEKIWKRAAWVSLQDNDVPVRSMYMISSLNQMIDAVTSREESRSAHVPESILWLLFMVCVTGSFIVGYAGKSKNADWIVLLSYSVMTVMTVYLILDLDQSRRGIITTSSTHQNMYDLLNSFKENE